MKKNALCLLALLIFVAAPAWADIPINLNAGELTSPASAPMQIDDAAGSSNGSLLLLIDGGSSNPLDSLNAGQYVSGSSIVLAAGGFNDFNGTLSTQTVFDIDSGVGKQNDQIA